MRALGIFLAISFHLGVILFGGVFLFNDKEKAAREEEVYEIDVEEEKPEEKPEEEKRDDTPKEEEVDTPPVGPAPEAPSLSDLQDLLGGVGGDGAFGGVAGLNAGGGIGGGGGAAGDGSGVLSSSQLDEKPRLVKRVDPKPPTALAKTLPQVTVTVYIDAVGNVMKADVTPSVAPAAMKTIMDAVMRWKYEPGVRNGQKVGCKVSHKINFQG